MSARLYTKLTSKRVDKETRRQVDKEISLTGLSLANNDFQEKQISLFTRILSTCLLTEQVANLRNLNKY